MLSVLENPNTQTKGERQLLLSAHYAFQRGRFISELSDRPDSVSAFSRITPSPMWNHTAFLSPEAATPEAFKEVYRWHAERNRRPVVYLDRCDEALAENLQGAGFELFDEETWMVFRDSGERNYRLDTNVRPVRNESDLQEFTRVFKASFQIKEHRYDEAIRSGANGPSQEHFILQNEGRAVCVGTLIWEGKLACIYNVGTPPAERRKGYADRMMRHITARAIEAGCETIFLQVENNSNASRLYGKLGFEVQFVRHGYRLSNWQPLKKERTRLSNILSPRATAGGSAAVFREVRPLDTEIAEALGTFASKNRLQLHHIILGAWAYLFHRYTGEDQVKSRIDSERAEHRDCITFIDRTRKVKEWLATVDGNAPANEQPIESEVLLRVSNSDVGHLEEARFPLEITFKSAPSPALQLSYDSELFSKDAIRRMASHLATILGSILETAEGTVADLEILSTQEKNQLLVGWNQNDFVPTSQTLQELFEKQVERTPDAIALSLAKARVSHPIEQMTYRQLNRKANKLAHRLRKLGVGPDVYVGVLLERSLQMIVSLLAIIKAGGACVPLDPAYPKERIQYILSDIDAPVLISTSRLVQALEVDSRIVFFDEKLNELAAESDKNPPVESAAENAAYVIYTSGSTGQPKGAVIDNNAIANHSIDCRKHYGLSARDRILQFSSFHFDASFEQIVPALITGATLVVRDEEVWNVREFGSKLKEFGLTVADIPTSYWHEVCDEWSANPDLIPKNSLRLVIVGGEALSPEKLALWQQTPMNNVRLINAYGPTETTITATSYEIPPRKNGESPVPVLPIGRPRADRTVYILDRFGNPAPIGIPGELFIGGTLLAKGYHNRPELTAARFIQNPFSDDPDARLYKTGDLVRYLEDGNIEFFGRIDDQIKIRGYRIELGEIKAALNKYDGIRESLVLPRERRAGEKRLIAYLLKEREDLSVIEIRNYLKSKLPSYMVPTHFVLMDQWPLMPSGKIDRQALPAIEDPATELTDISGPRDSLELQLQLLFERVLKRAPIGINESFFELGGDSLQALELLVEIEKAVGKNLPLGTLYQSSTVESLSREVRDRSEPNQWSSLVPLQTSGKRPPFYLLHTTPGDILGYGNLVFHLPQDQPCYGFQSLGLKDSSLAHLSILEMARYYVTLLRKFQPQGPYYLGGWCYGGIVAIEMARLLQATGARVGLLALLETVALPPSLSNWRYYNHRIKCSIRMNPGRLFQYVREKVRYTRNSKIANRMRFRQAAGLLNADLSEIDPRLARLEYVYNRNLEALNKYKSESYSGRVTLFNAAEKDPALISDPHYGWIGLADEIEIHEVPGNHDTMLTEPNVRMLAQKLDESLRRAQEQDKAK